MASRRRRAAILQPPCHFRELPLEVHLQIAGYLDDPCDCAALCLALPPLGCVALREIDKYGAPLVSVALRFVATDGAELLNEELLRHYATRGAPTVVGCEWLGKMFRARAGSDLHLRREELAGGGVRWRLFQDDASRAFVREDNAELAQVLHFEGEQGSERVVRATSPSAAVMHYEGKQGHERVVRIEHPSGSVAYFEGEAHSERAVRMEHADGWVQYYTGEKGVERIVRMEQPDGSVQHFEGDKGSERLVRAVWPDGCVHHCEGERGSEQMIAVEWPDGSVQRCVGVC